ncbi:MAG: hypothetical protein Q6370_020665 [Candidatus Sigynarchaeota archaeon]
MKKEDLPAVINGSLKERLIALNIRNVNKIIQDILTKLATRDSI